MNLFTQCYDFLTSSGILESLGLKRFEGHLLHFSFDEITTIQAAVLVQLEKLEGKESFLSLLTDI